MNDNETTSTALTTAGYEQVTGLQVFATSESVSGFLAEIKAAARSVPQDMSTAAGRKGIASTAHKVARLKSHFDAMGKDLVSEQKATIKAVDIERKRLRDELDDLKAEVRAPLTAWEAAEEQRVEKIQGVIARMSDPVGEGATASDIFEQLAKLKDINIDEFFAEFTQEAATAKDKGVAALELAHAAAVQREKDAAELERLKKEAAKKEQAEREDAIRREAADRARKDAEAKAAAERLEAERKASAEREAADRARKDAEHAAEKAKLEAELSAQRERARIEAEAKAKADEAAKRAADETRQREVLDDITRDIKAVASVPDADAKNIAHAMIAGKIAHTKVAH